MSARTRSELCRFAVLATVAGFGLAMAASPVPASAVAAVPAGLPAAAAAQDPAGEVGPEVYVDSPRIEWGDPRGDVVPYQWTVAVDNPNARPVVVRVQLDFIDDTGAVIHEDHVSGLVAGTTSSMLAQNGAIGARDLEYVAEARGEPSASWGDEAYRVRTLYAFVTNFRAIDVFFVLENWVGRPVTEPGTVDLYVYEIEPLRAEFDGGGMRRGVRQLFGRRFEVYPGDFKSRRIGFIAADYAPPAVTLGPIHYSIFDREPTTHEGLVRLVFHTESGAQLVAEDKIFF